jgi:hypothetical protein
MKQLVKPDLRIAVQEDSKMISDINQSIEQEESKNLEGSPETAAGEPKRPLTGRKQPRKMWGNGTPS